MTGVAAGPSQAGRMGAGALANATTTAASKASAVVAIVLLSRGRPPTVT